MSGLCGYGRILEVDLSTSEIVRQDVAPEFARKYIGGIGFGSKILYDRVGPTVDPFSPDNVIVFAIGPLAGTQAPCSGRIEVTTKSPLTNTMTSGSTGGIWGAALRRAGFSAIVIRNKSRNPVYLWIDNDKVELRDARHLWGNDTNTTEHILSEELDDTSKPKISVLAIGQAGESLVRYACVLNDSHHVACRGGMGAVMGDKKLKAIAVRGTGEVRVAKPEEFRAAAKEARQRVLSITSRVSQQHSTNVVLRTQQEGSFAYKNYQTGVLPQWVENLHQDIARKYVTKMEGTCSACPIPCFHLVEVKEGKYAGTKVSRGLHAGVVLEWGAKCGINNLPAIWKCKELCQKLGMDYVSAAGTIAFSMELFQRKVINSIDTDGLELDWGNEDAVIELLHKIASRDGFGDILAEGSVRAAARIGKGADKYVMSMKGMEMMSFDPRSGPRGFVFGDLTDPVHGDNLKGTHGRLNIFNLDLQVDDFDMPEDVKKNIFSMPVAQYSSTWDGKPMMCRWFEDLYSLVSASGLCFFVAQSLGPTHLSRMLSSCTGWDITPEEARESGERIFTMLKAYSTRQGLARSDDSWPDRFYTEALPEGPSKGAVLSREEMNRLLDQYYELRAWDKSTGLPTREKLIELGLSDVASELTKLGKLSG